MGICNLSPDSFSGDGLGSDIEAVVAQARRFVTEGADIIDVGGESTRPGTEPASVDDVDKELQLVIPAIERLASELAVPLSIDTYKSSVARQAVKAGANMINDIWGLRRDPRIAQVAADAGVPIILMHNQKGAAYKDMMAEVLDSLRWSASQAIKAGVPAENIIIDPGIGLGKTVEHNLEIMRRLDEFSVPGYPLLLGTSRKSIIGKTLNLPADQRLEGTAATVALGISFVSWIRAREGSSARPRLTPRSDRFMGQRDSSFPLLSLYRWIQRRTVPRVSRVLVEWGITHFRSHFWRRSRC